MNDIVYGLILTSLAGLATLIGFFVTYIKGNPNIIVGFFLGLASGVMTLISLIDLIPLSFSYFSNYFLIYRLLLISFFIVLGIALSFLTNYLLEKYESDSLKVIGFLSVISMILHNLPEGMMTFITSQHNKSLGLSLAIAIGLHNIPEGISIAIPLYYATKNRLKVFLIVLLVGLSEFFGGIIIFLLFDSYINDIWMGIVYALIAGIMLSISLFNLLPKGISLCFKKALIGVILGIIIMGISHYLV